MSHGWMNRHRQHFSFNKALLCVAHPAVIHKHSVQRKNRAVYGFSFYAQSCICTECMHVIILSHGYENRITWRPVQTNTTCMHVSLQGALFIHCLINCKPAIENILNFSFFATIIPHSCRLQFTFFTPLSLCLRQTVPYGFLHYWEREMLNF